LIADASMAHKLNQLLTSCDSKDVFFIACHGKHMSFDHGVPELLWQKNTALRAEIFTILCTESQMCL
jgi:hypothetical protein